MPDATYDLLRRVLSPPTGSVSIVEVDIYPTAVTRATVLGAIALGVASICLLLREGWRRSAVGLAISVMLIGLAAAIIRHEHWPPNDATRSLFLALGGLSIIGDLVIALGHWHRGRGPDVG